MRILVAVVHYWDPAGSGHHGSLRPNPRPRIEAFQQQILSLMRLSQRQAQLTMETLTADPANKLFQHQIDIKVITDGEHHVLDQLDAPFRGLFQMVVSKPEGPKHLGFEAQKFLASRLNENYDLYAYFEDDLIVLDPGFFRKINWFRTQAGDECVLLPHRIEFSSVPNVVDRFFIDGPIAEDELSRVIPDPSPAICSPYPGGTVYFESPRNPHSGCFVLSGSQLQHWMHQPWWQDGDCSLISPLESAASLGVAKTFRVFKPAMANASWLELQHWGTNFHCLIGKKVALPSQQSEDNTEAQEPN